MNEIRITSAIVGTAISEWLGGIDGLIQTLLIFVVIDYITGVIRACLEKKLSSEIGFRGILKKILIFILVGIANTIDVFIIEGEEHLIKTAVIFFYLSNEGISILENANRLGLPIPQKLSDFLQQLKDKNDSEKKSR